VTKVTVDFGDTQDRAWVLADSSLKIGMLTFEDADWIFRSYSEDLDIQGDPQVLPVQRAQSERFQRERIEVVMARSTGVATDALVAELEGRIAVFRDETREAAVFMARVKGKQLLNEL
jgi:hypothetical protein